MVVASSSSLSFGFTLLEKGRPISSRSRLFQVTTFSPRSLLLRGRQSLLSSSGSRLSFSALCLFDSKATEVTEKSWENSVLISEIPVLVVFYTPWYGPCQITYRIINEIAVDYAGKLNCYVLNADTNLLMTKKYDIKAVPVVMLFKNGKKQESIIGTMPKKFYISAIERLLNS